MRLRANAVQQTMAVLSNKPVNPSRDIVQALGLGDYLVRIDGGNSIATKNPDPLGAEAPRRSCMKQAWRRERR